METIHPSDYMQMSTGITLSWKQYAVMLKIPVEKPDEHY